MATDRMTPAQRKLREIGGPAYFEISEVEPPSNSVSAFAPDDWRLYYLMRELPVADRLRVMAFAEMLYNIRHSMDWATVPVDETTSQAGP